MDERHHEIDFLASVTHDLKSPLNAILCTIGMVKSDILAGRQDKESMLSNLALAETAGRDMLELVNNMLTTARMQAGQETVHPMLLSRGDIIERAANIEHTFHNEALGKKVDLSLTIGRLPNFVYWDAKKIRYFAINNLISNALKFVGRKGGTVKVTVESDPQDNVVISVMDDGPGIPVSERAGVFGKFVQASNNTRNFQGGGFGLFNAHQTITMHKGSIEILDGLNGKGVTFRVTLPAIPFELDEQAARQIAAAKSAPQNQTAHAGQQT